MSESLGVIIPVREGSSRIRKKVLLPFETDSDSLLEWKIKQIKEVIASKNIIVSTESKKLKKIAEENGVEIHHREKYLAQNHKAKFSDVITGIVRDIQFDHIAWVTVVVPLMSPDDYKNAFLKYFSEVVENNIYDSLVSVNLVKEYLWNDSGPLNYELQEKHPISQDLPDIYRVTNGLYMRDKKSILKDRYFIGTNPYKFIVSKLSGIDIDEYEDYEIARTLLKIYKKSVAPPTQ